MNLEIDEIRSPENTQESNKAVPYNPSLPSRIWASSTLLFRLVGTCCKPDKPNVRFSFLDSSYARLERLPWEEKLRERRYLVTGLALGTFLTMVARLLFFHVFAPPQRRHHDYARYYGVRLPLSGNRRDAQRTLDRS